MRWLRRAIFGGLGWTSLLFAATACAGPPTDTEQYWLQLVNRFRANPSAELDLLVNYRVPGTGVEWDDPMSDSAHVASALEFFDVDPAVLRSQFQDLQPVPPLAWNENLHQSARYYSNLIIESDEQSHELDEHNIFERMQKEGGYEITGGGSAAENLFAFVQDVEYGHAGFVVDWGDTPTGIQNPPGHRDNLLAAELREIGIAIAVDSDESTRVGPLVATQHLAVDFADGPFATGVIHQDKDGNDFYSPGEGLGGVRIELQQSNGNAVATTTTYASGGYRLDLSGIVPGRYKIVLHDPAPVYWSDPIEITDADQNVPLDLTDPQHDIDSMSRVLREDGTWSLYDLNGDGDFTPADRSFLINEVLRTYLGDSNLDGEFNSGDLVDVFTANEYEDELVANSVWATGDWTGDAEFDTGDLVEAFQEGGYEQGPRPSISIVPEPSSLAWTLVTALIAMASKRRRRNDRSPAE